METEVRETDEIDNPPNWNLLALAAIVVSILLGSGIVLSIMTESLVPVVLGFIVSLPPLGATLYTELNRRPIGIRIKEDGFFMIMRSSKTRFVRWEDIRDIYLRDSGRAQVPTHDSMGTKGKYGSVRLRGERIPYNFPSQTVREIVRSYSSRVGHAPDEWDGKSR